MPHAWHSPHRPTHLPVVQPHSEQQNVGRAALVALFVATSTTLGAATDKRRTPLPAGPFHGDQMTNPRNRRLASSSATKALNTVAVPKTPIGFQPASRSALTLNSSPMLTKARIKK